MKLSSLVLAFAMCALAQQPERVDPPFVKDIAPRRIVLSVPGMNDVHVRKNVVYKRAGTDELKMDVYTPASAGSGAKLHGVIFIHGGYLPPNLLTEPKDWGDYISLGQLAAASGLAGITFNHRLYSSWNALRDSKADLRDLIVYVRSHADALGIDPDHITLWAFSGGGPLLADEFRNPQPYVTSVVDYFAILDLRAAAADPKQNISPELAEEFSVVPLVANDKPLPAVFIGRAGLDAPWLNKTLDDFVAAALRANLNVTVANHAQGKHGFEILNDDERTREILRETIEFIRAH
jgi:acetyl esterase/lipase